MSANEIREGSIRELWNVTSSLMISFFSMVAMMFCDRLFLSYYSSSALNAATSAGTLFWMGCFTLVTLTTMAEVFVAQYNGQKNYRKLGEPVWQMLWLSGFSIIFFVFLAEVGSRMMSNFGLLNGAEVEYYKWNNFIAPLFAFQAALSAFFIGQGKTRIIKWLAILGNVVNVVIDPILIFGIKGWVPSMGIPGAAIATGLGILAEVVILSVIFLSPKNQQNFGSADWKFKLKPFFKCLKVGFPPAVFVMFELLGWSLFYMMMRQIGEKHLHVMSVIQSILISLFFFGFALEKGGAAIAGNLIGAKIFHEVKRVLKSGAILTLLFTAVVSFVLIGFPDILINQFFKNSPEISAEALLEIKTSIKFGLGITLIYLTIENLRFLINGVLTSAGDTFFLMIAGTFSIWLFLLTPTYLFVLKPKAPVETAFYIWVFYSCISTGIMFFRFKQGKWKKKHLVANDLDAKAKLVSMHSSGDVPN